MGTFLGRTSLSQTINLIEIISEPCRRPLVLDDFPDQRPLLVFVSKKTYSANSARYFHLVQGLNQLYEDENIRLFELPLTYFEKRIAQQEDYYRTLVDSTTMYAHSEIASNDSLVTFFYKSFDAEKSNYAYKGGGAKSIASRTPFVFFDGSLPVHQTEYVNVLSFWSKMDYDLAPKSKVTYTEYLPATGEIIKSKTISFFKYIRSVDRGWMLMDIPLQLERADSHLKVTFINEDLLYGEEFYLDEVHIRPATSRLFKKTKDWIMVNNRWIPRKKQK